LRLTGAGTASQPQEVALRHEANEAVWRAIRALPDDMRLPVILRYYHDLPVAEMVAVLAVSERTVHTRLHTAHERLRVLLEMKVVYEFV
jgi:RNA polymerase sigma factor (sigma-70 family)